MASMLDRMIRAAMLDPKLYEEVEADRGALGQAMGVVVLASIAGGVGSGLLGGFTGIFFGVIVALVAWFIWAGLTYLIGTKILPEAQTRADIGELLRTIGFSSSPGLLRVFGFIPGITWIVFFISGVWMLAAMVIAVRQALDYRSTFRAVGVCVIGWVVQIIVMMLLMPLIKT
jgi:hypothetical protein